MDTNMMPLIIGSVWTTLFVNIFLIGMLLLIVDHIRSIGKITIHLFIDKIKSSKEEFSKDKSENNNRISILIPAHDEENNISEMISSALQLKYKNKEIIVIDDCSTDRTYSIAKKFADEGKIKLLHRNKNGSKALALNYASKYATGDLIMVIDADGKIDGSSCLDHVNKVIDDSDIGAISGCIVPSKGDSDVVNTITRLQTIEYLVGMELGKRIQSFFNAILVISGGLGIFRKNLFLATGKYNNKTIGEDIDITLNCQRFHPKVIFLPELKADLRCPNNLKTLIKQRRRWARGQLESLLINKDMHLFSNNKTTIKLAIADMWINDVVFNFLWAGFWIFFIVGSVLQLVDSPNVITAEFFSITLEGFEKFLYQLPEIIENPTRDVIIENYYHIVAVLFLGYFILEPITFLYTIKISGRRECIKLIYLIPVMIFYRNFLRIITILGYLDVILKRKREW